MPLVTCIYCGGHYVGRHIKGSKARYPWNHLLETARVRQGRKRHTCPGVSKVCYEDKDMVEHPEPPTPYMRVINWNSPDKLYP